MRLFVAIDLPAWLEEAVSRLPRPHDELVRWTTAAQWHVTLRFLGEVAPGALPGPAGLVAALRTVPSAMAAEGGMPVGAVLGPTAEWFPGRHVLQVPVAGVDALAACVARATAGWGRPFMGSFQGHLTLARSRGQKRGPAALAGAGVSGRWEVEEVVLYSSTPAPGGHRYEALERVTLSA